MTEDETRRLANAVDHLRAFKQTFNAGEPVDEESCLTADDLILIVDLLERIQAIALAAPPER